MRIDVERQRYVYFQDVERFDEATIFVSGAVATVESDFVVWDSHERRVVHDSREVRKKLAAQKTTAPTG